MERHSQGTQAGSQDGQWSPQVPGVTNIGNGESRHRPWTELQQWLERVPSGPRNSGGGGSGSGSARRGMHGPGRAIPEAQAPDPRVLGDTARIRRSPWDMWGPGGHRTARTLLPRGPPELCRSVPPMPAASRLPRTGVCRSYCGS